MSYKSELHTPHDHSEDRTSAELRESAYRRGYHQAVHEIKERLVEGADVLDIINYERIILHWRYRLAEFEKPRDVVQPPPRAKIKLDGGVTS